MNKQIKIHSATRWSYFQWFLLGFYWLQDEGKIKVDIDVPLLQHIGLWNHNGFLSRCSNRIFQSFYDDQRECKIVCVNRYCMNLLYAPYWGKQR